MPDMPDKDRNREQRNDPKHGQQEQPGQKDRKAAPPIEREHETQQGALEEEQKKQPERK